MKKVLFDVDSGLGLLTLNDSENGNKLNGESIQAINKALDTLIEDDAVKIILIRSDGRNFCLGMDLDFAEENVDNEDEARKVIQSYTVMLNKIEHSPKAVFAMVNGDVKAGGIGLICACDGVFASEISTFELSEVLLGLIPANVLPFLLKRLSPQKARYLILSAKRLGAKEAFDIQLIDEVFENDIAEKQLKAVLKTLFRANPGALSETKRFILELENKTLDESIELSRSKLFEIISRKEIRDGIKSFSEGMMPDWLMKFKPKQKLIL